MKISCPSCSAAYELDDARVPPAGLSIKCPKCKKPFTVHKPKGGEAAKTLGGSAVPLPGQSGGKPARPATQPASGGPVPLPGTSEAKGSPAPAAGGGGAAVPLPGLDGASQSAKAAASGFGSDTLPGLDDPLPPPKPGKAPAKAAMDDPFGNIEMAESKRVPSAPSQPMPELDFGGKDAVASRPPAVAAAGSASPKSSAPFGGDEMLDFVDENTAVAPKAGDKKKRPAPPTLPKSDPVPSSDAFAPLPTSSPAVDRKAEKDRQKRERDEKIARDREERERRKAERRSSGGVRALFKPGRIAAAVIVGAIVGVGFLGYEARDTADGLFWTNRWMSRLFPAKKSATPAQTKVIQRGMERLGEGDFASTREAVASAAQLLAVLPDDEDVKAFFVLAASELRLDYEQSGTDWDQARRVVERLKGTRVALNRARGAFALASGDAMSGRQLLATIGETPSADLESTWLYANALLRTNEWERAAQVLDNALKARGPSTKLLLLRGKVAAQRGQFAEAAGAYQKALDNDPKNGRAMIELAAARLHQGQSAAAADLLARALDSDIRKDLEAAEEARGHMLRGKLMTAPEERKIAEAAYERAIALDPNSPRVHESYGEFRLARHEWDKAARQFEAAIQNGGSAAAYAGAARAYLGQNRLLEADKDVNLAVQREPNNPAYLFLQGKVAEAIGKGEEAFRKFEAALEKKPDLTEALAAEGQIWISRGEKAKAAEKLKRALKTVSHDTTAQADEAIGDLGLALGDVPVATAAFARALQKQSDDALAHAGMGKALAAKGELAAARKELEIALTQLDGDASVTFEYGSVLRRMGDVAHALDMLRKAVKLDPKEPRYRARLGGLLVEQGAYDEAEAQLRQAVQLDDRNAEGQYFLARALAGRKQLSAAIDSMRSAVEIDPDNPEYQYYMGIIYEQGQQVQDAIEALTRAIEKNPDNADAHEHLGIELMVENRYRDAVAAFRKASELNPRRAKIWALVAEAEQQGGDAEGAIRDFQKALTLDATLRGVWTKLGIAYKERDCNTCRTKAIDALRRALLQDPKDSTAHHELGYMFKDGGRRREAIAEFRRYLELKPDAGDASTVQDDIYYMQEESRRTP